MVQEEMSGIGFLFQFFMLGCHCSFKVRRSYATQQGGLSTLVGFKQQVLARHALFRAGSNYFEA